MKLLFFLLLFFIVLISFLLLFLFGTSSPLGRRSSPPLKRPPPTGSALIGPPDEALPCRPCPNAPLVLAKQTGGHLKINPMLARGEGGGLHVWSGMADRLFYELSATTPSAEDLYGVRTQPPAQREGRRGESSPWRPQGLLTDMEKTAGYTPPSKLFTIPSNGGIAEKR